MKDARESRWLCTLRKADGLGTVAGEGRQVYGGTKEVARRGNAGTIRGVWRERRHATGRDSSSGVQLWVGSMRCGLLTPSVLPILACMRMGGSTRTVYWAHFDEIAC